MRKTPQDLARELDIFDLYQTIIQKIQVDQKKSIDQTATFSTNPDKTEKVAQQHTDKESLELTKDEEKNLFTALNKLHQFESIKTDPPTKSIAIPKSDIKELLKNSKKLKS